MDLRDLSIFMTLLKYSFENTDVVLPDPKILFCMAPFVADAVGINPNCIKTLLAVLSTFFY